MKLLPLTVITIILWHLSTSSIYGSGKHIGPNTPTPDYNETSCDIIVGPTTQYKTIQSGIKAAESGDTICVRAGLYTELVAINKTNLTLRGQNAKTTIIDGELKRPGTLNVGQGPGAENCGEDQSFAQKGLPYVACSTYEPLVDIRASGVTLDGFTIDRSRGRAMRVYNNGNRINNVTIQNIIVPFSRKSNLHVMDSDNIVIAHSDLREGEAFAQYPRSGHIINHGPGSIGLSNTANALITNNILRESWGEAIIADVKDSGTNSIVVQDNIIYDHMASLYFHGLRNALLQRNLIYNSEQGKADGRNHSLVVVPAEPWFTNVHAENIVIINNVFATTTVAPAVRSGTVVNGVKNVDIYNNTFYSQTAGVETARLVGNITDVKVRNNIFYHKFKEPTLAKELGPAQFSLVSHNCWSDLPLSRLQGNGDIQNCNPQFVGSDGNGTIPTLNRGQVKAEWFQVRQNSPTINKGANLSGNSISWVNQDHYVIDDYQTFNRPNNSTFDLGAFEFGGTPEPSIPTENSWDLNNDSRVNLFDFSSFIPRFRLNFSFPDISLLTSALP